MIITAILTVIGLCVAVKAAEAHIPSKPHARPLEAPLLHWLRYARQETNGIARAKCVPRPYRSVRPASRVPEFARRFTIRVELARQAVYRLRDSECLPVSPIGKPGTVILGKAMAATWGWTGAQWDCLYRLWDELESRWYVYADNPNSSAYGIPQALPGWKMGPGWQSSARVQIRWGLGYIRGRYGSPCSALSYRLAHGYY